MFTQLKIDTFRIVHPDNSYCLTLVKSQVKPMDHSSIRSSFAMFGGWVLSL